MQYGKTEEYYEGGVDMAARIADDMCDDCGNGDEAKLDEKTKVWKHGRRHCKAQRAQFLRRSAERDKDEAYLNARYGSMWHHYYKIKEFMLSQRCYCCGKRATKRCDYNCWGTVAEFDACDECAEKYDGICADMIPKYKEKANV
jgi:hypothetical protein